MKRNIKREANNGQDNRKRPSHTKKLYGRSYLLTRSAGSYFARSVVPVAHVFKGDTIFLALVGVIPRFVHIFGLCCVHLSVAV